MNKIVTICGSMKFQEQMIELARKLELEERCIVLQCVYFEKGRVLTAQETDTLNELHYRKIDISDAIYVVNVGGYIGETTRKEIEYARSLGKELLFLEPAGDFGETAVQISRRERRGLMKIEHVAMYVNDLEGAKDFFVKYFDASPNEGYHNRTTDFRSYFLRFQDGARLEIMTRPAMDDAAKTLARTGFIHIAFSVGSKEKVDALTARLKADGYAVSSGPRTTGDGYYESCVIALEDNQIEITV